MQPRKICAKPSKPDIYTGSEIDPRSSPKKKETTMSIKYQQGDVLLVAVPNKEVLNIKENYHTKTHEDQEGKIVLAEGEATGHHHRFEIDRLDSGVFISSFHSRPEYYRRSIGRFPEYIHIEGGEATLYHEEHNPLTIKPGLYRRSIVREFDHISNLTRKVVD